jgi:hypothetical protein
MPDRLESAEEFIADYLAQRLQPGDREPLLLAFADRDAAIRSQARRELLLELAEELNASKQAKVWGVFLAADYRQRAAKET